MANKVSYRFRSLFVNFFTIYSTVKEIEVRSTYIAIIHRFIQLVVIGYIVFYVIWTEKGYQNVENPHGSTLVKVKGVAKVSIDNFNSSSNNTEQLLWDTTEYLIPPLEDNAFFIATRKTVTFNQTRSTCPSLLDDRFFCNSIHNPCKRGTPTPNANGFFTGNCVPSQENRTKHVCEIKAWCPEESANAIDYKIDHDDLQNFTIFLKTMVTFTSFNINIRTVKDNTNFSCRFHGVTDRRCPVFSMGYILQNLHNSYGTVDLMALYLQGGLIEIRQDWDCNFDFSQEEKNCFPTFSFNLLQSGTDQLSPGINYRFAEIYIVNGKQYRTLTKTYGLRFIISIGGKGRRFHALRLFLAIGSSVGYMAIAEVVCEFILMKFHKYRTAYIRNKVKKCRLNQPLLPVPTIKIETAV